MTRKHFIAIAAILKRALDNTTTEREADLVALIARNLACEMSVTNERFRINQFLIACGLDTNGYADWVKVAGE